LSGNGVKPVAAQISITPTALSFGNQSVGSTSAAKTVTLQNTGTANLSTSAHTSGLQALRMAAATMLLAVLTLVQTALVSFSLRPATLCLLPRSPKSTSIFPYTTLFRSLSGNGVKPVAAQISITPTALSFGNQSVGSTSAAKTVTLQNTGTANL